MLQEQARIRLPNAVRGERRGAYKWWVLSVTSLGMFLATVNCGTLLIALPDVERALGTSLLTLVWVILAYMVASTVLLLTGRAPGRPVRPASGLSWPAWPCSRSPPWAPASPTRAPR